MSAVNLPEGARLVTLGATIRLTYDRPDGLRLEMCLTRARERVTALYAVQDPAGRLAHVTARSWPVGGAAPELGGQIDQALRSAARNA